MLLYIFKSAACMAIFFVFYKLLLERENMHVFKRFYLLLAIGASLLIPSLVFTEYVVVEPAPPMKAQQSIATDYDYIGVPQALENDVLDIEPILWTVYFLGFAFFGLKFLKNLFQIISRIRKNPKQKASRFIQVLLKENFPPHTFFSYIFLNKKKLEANEIPKEVILHEETHAVQKHSWDVIFIELLQVIFWFNPLIYLFKKSIKLNHEFLADQAVLKKDIDETTYQNTLLSYLSPDSQNKYQSKLANAINYSSIKKRFTVMKTQTSKKAVFLRSLLLLPLLAVLVLSFSQTNLKQVSLSNNTSQIINDVNIEIIENGNLIMNNEVVPLEEISQEAIKVNPNLEPRYLRNYVTANILYAENQTELIEKVEDELQKLGISNIEHISKRTSDLLKRVGFKPSLYKGKTLSQAKSLRQEQVFRDLDSHNNDTDVLDIVWIEIKKENQIWIDEKQIDLKNIASKLIEQDNDRLEIQIYSAGVLRQSFLNQISEEIEKVGVARIKVFTDEYIMPENDFVSEDVPITPRTTILKANKMTFEGSSIQDGASRKLISEYNSLAKKYNSMLSKSKSIQIKKKEVDRLEYIYGLMSEKQKVDAEPFPDFPEPPPPPKAPKIIKGGESDIPLPPRPKENGILIGAFNVPRGSVRVDAGGTTLEEGVDYTVNYQAGTVQILDPSIKAANIPINISIENNVVFGQQTRSSIRSKEERKEIEKGLKDEIENQEIIAVENVQVYEYNLGLPLVSSPRLMKDLQILAKRDAQFYFDEKKISKKKGMNLIRNKKGITVETFPWTNKKPEVKIYGTVKTKSLTPPNPPEPKSPLDYAIEMAKKDAIFYFEGKEITSDKAIELLKINKDLNMDARATKSKRPVIKLSKEPIVVDN